MARSPQVFISYSHQNFNEMTRIRDEFLRLGIQIWTDEHLKPGTPSWKVAIENEIRRSQGVAEGWNRGLPGDEGR